jgi:outer membrane lipoprotein-sorting protein
MTTLLPALRVLVAIAMGSAVSAPISAAPDDPWLLLGQLRQNLSATPQKARFVQEYLPAGFNTGDRETGVLYLAIPKCVRWDYLDPYPKSFLLCDTEIYTWNPDDSAGRRFEFSDSEETGIDLLRLRLEELRSRYHARLEIGDPDSIIVVLSPVNPDFVLTEARLRVDGLGQRLLGLSYSDQEGNTSRFEISDYEALADEAVFEPPADLEWIEE